MKENLSPEDIQVVRQTLGIDDDVLLARVSKEFVDQGSVVTETPVVIMYSQIDDLRVDIIIAEAEVEQWRDDTPDPVEAVMPPATVQA